MDDAPSFSMDITPPSYDQSIPQVATSKDNIFHICTPPPSPQKLSSPGTPPPPSQDLFITPPPSPTVNPSVPHRPWLTTLARVVNALPSCNVDERSYKSERDSVEEGDSMAVNIGIDTSAEEGDSMAVNIGIDTSVEEGDSMVVNIGSDSSSDGEEVDLDATVPIQRRRVVVANNDHNIVYDYNHGLPW